jgi:hypothetical protein
MNKAYLCLILLGIGFMIIASSSTRVIATDNTEDKVNKEADKIGKIITDKIKNDPELSDYTGHCYKSVDNLKGCTDKITEEVQPLYDDAQKKLENNSD